MYIILYKNCILNNKYREVFSTQLFEDNGSYKLPFTDYLGTLDYFAIRIDNRFINDKGTINVPIGFKYSTNSQLLQSCYDYNYMKIEQNDIKSMNYNNMQLDGADSFSFTKYYFISKIEMSNNVAIIHYEIDYWHSYVYCLWDRSFDFSMGTNDFNIRYGVLSSSKIVEYNNNFKLQYYKPPMDYTGNNFLDIERTKKQTDDEKVYLIATLSRYETRQSGEYSGRETDVFLIGIADNSNTETSVRGRINGAMHYFSNYSNKFIQNADSGLRYGEIINKFILNSSSTTNTLHDNKLKYYDVLEVHAIPYSMAHYDDIVPFENNLLTQITDYIDIEIKLSDTNIINTELVLVPLWQFSGESNFGASYKLYEKTIENDFTIRGVGFMSRLFNIVPNGNDIAVKIYCGICSFSFHLFLSVQNSIYDISDEFKIETPVQVSTASTMALAKLTREVNANKIANQKVSAVLSFTENEANNIGKMAGGFATMGVTGSAMGVGSVISGLVGIGTESGKLAINLDTLKQEMKLNSAKVYTSNVGIDPTSIAEVNCAYGLIIASILPDNETEVNASIKAFGYDCSEIVENENIIFLSKEKAFAERYNVLKFSDVTVYGRFPQEVAQIIENILKNGVRIWYTKDITV